MSGRLILVRHGQSQGNVERRLDTRPPGADLTELGRGQARAFAGTLTTPPGLLAHSVARRAIQTADEIGGQLRVDPLALADLHEVQAGELEDRSDDEAIAEFNAIYERWHEGELDLAMPGGESGRDVLDRYIPVLTDLRLRFLDDHSWSSDIVVVSHGAAIRLAASALAGVDSSYVLDHHLANTEAVVLAPITDGRWSCVKWGADAPPFHAQSGIDPVGDALKSSDPMG